MPITIRHYPTSVRVPNDNMPLLTARRHKLMFPRIIKRINTFLMQVKRLLLVLQINVVNMNQTVQTRRDNVLQVRIVLDLGNPRVVHQYLALFIPLLKNIIGLVFLRFDLILRSYSRIATFLLFCFFVLDGCLLVLELGINLRLESVDNGLSMAYETVGRCLRLDLLARVQWQVSHVDSVDAMVPFAALLEVVHRTITELVTHK